MLRRFDSFEAKSIDLRNTFFRYYLVNTRQNEVISADLTIQNQKTMRSNKSTHHLCPGMDTSVHIQVQALMPLCSKVVSRNTKPKH